ncbi:50S ribosomal protein L25/general stress protein Ctc [Sphingomonadaceae bacterium G21617-S1]|jgi:large subunit ribosomal protein L25|uniref:50S ribosomal protein L25/general stress protein Ctc n=1 Tax=Rhizorhabdus sp. TaxID=1968843 RepID=UPI00121F7951|nr:50S ribosomal protein L25/general stress protein Ctc [Rhizorhabdus sp.]MBD3759173.1 50S ribosomal protein L25/general stress protein Ctc [Rhizorhabdus sp.]MCZ4342059.1 50S ribosomal protein L25/general stress protein Ctc [Sphingomonadaceae bacterium G21617-S1]TAK17839.1 MAG: 50S ribosomal protein L25/general stress protein Ctc [Rhizorhabdus sp.]
MSEVLNLSAEARERAGKGASRAIRREGRVPAVIYGNKQEPTSVHIEEKVLMKLLHTGHFFNSVVMLDVGSEKIRTLPKDVQFHPVTDRPLHADFLRIGEHSTVNVNVPVRFTDEELSPGIKRGGVLNIVIHDLGLSVDAAEIPDEIVVSLEGLDVGENIHLSQITLPKGATALDHTDITIATIVAPSALKSSEGGEAAEGEEAAEG